MAHFSLRPSRHRSTGNPAARVAEENAVFKRATLLTVLFVLSGITFPVATSVAAGAASTGPTASGGASVQTIAVDTSASSNEDGFVAAEAPSTLEPFQMFGASWSGTADELSARVRTASGWGEWFSLARSSDAPQPGTVEARTYDASTKTSEPIFIGDASDYQIEAPADVTGVRVHLVRNGADADPQFAAASFLPGGAPPIFLRSAWGARPATSAPAYSPSIKMAFVHHTAGSNNYSAADVPGILRGIQAFEQDSQGYSDIAYNFLVDRFGRVWEGRGGGLDRNVLSAATGGFNTSSVSVAVMGDYTVAVPTQASVDSLAQVIGWKLGVSGVSPFGIATMTSSGNDLYAAGTVVDFNAVSGHLDAKPTACPGGYLYQRLAEVRAKANDTVAVVANSPFGRLDIIRQGPAGLHVVGWTIDANAGAGAVQVDVWIDGQPQSFFASAARPDIGNAFPAYGSNHGFDTYLSITPGDHHVCAMARNVGAGRDSQLDCVDIRTYDTPLGSIDSVLIRPDGVHLTGWAFDPNSATSIDIHTHVDGTNYVWRTGVSRPDVAAVFPEYGPAHGFDVVVPAPFSELCVFGINLGPGLNSIIGCPSTASSPLGSADLLMLAPEGVRATGWAFDPNSAAPISVRMIVDGQVRATATASNARPDIAAAFPAYGAAHGYSVSANPGPGPHVVCVDAVNVGPGFTPLLRCVALTLGDNPIGFLDQVVAGGPTGRRAIGWTFDPNAIGPIQVHVHVMTPAGDQLVVGVADEARPDIGAAFPFFGSDHGFDVPIPSVGQVCAYGINAGPGGHAWIGCMG
jgi:hypothetical protein